MAPTRIRKFNTKDTYPDLCQAVAAGNTVYLHRPIAQPLFSQRKTRR